MPSTILSDNGASSGTAGIKTTGSNDGVLQLQTTTAGGTATAALTIDTSQNVGIGTASPTEKLDVLGNTDTTLRVRATSDTALILNETTPNKTWKIKSSDGTLAFQYSSTAYNSSFSSKAFITSDGYLRMASGTGGIQFGGDTAAANALDDYEEGTWTPTLTADTTAPTVTYSAQIGSYRKIGSQVLVEFNLAYTGRSGGSGTAWVGGLPFQAFSHSPDSRAFEAIAVWGGPSFTGTIFGIVGGSSTNIIMYYIVSGNANAQDIGAMSTSGSIRGSFLYITS